MTNFMSEVRGLKVPLVSAPAVSALLPSRAFKAKYESWRHHPSWDNFFGTFTDIICSSLDDDPNVVPKRRMK